MYGFSNRRLALPAEYPWFHQLRHRLVEAFNVAHAAAEDYHIRIEDIDHVGQRLRQTHLVALQRLFGQRILLANPLHNRIAR